MTSEPHDPNELTPAQEDLVGCGCALFLPGLLVTLGGIALAAMAGMMPAPPPAPAGPAAAGPPPDMAANVILGGGVATVLGLVMIVIAILIRRRSPKGAPAVPRS